LVTANRPQVLMLCVPGRMQVSLLTLLNAIPQLEVVNADVEHWPSSAVKAETTPDLVLLDFDLSVSQTIERLKWIHANWLSARGLVLANTAQQELAARAAGADGVLIRGFSATEFFAAVKTLLNGKVTLNPKLLPPPMPDQEESADEFSDNLDAPGA
jgi:DNA-binding NarL/FixJ family response regulator